MTKLILATTSKYRLDSFRFLDLDFISQGSNVDEYFEGRPNSPEELVRHLSKLKAESVAKTHNTGIVIGFDTVGCINGKILEKPKSRNEAFERLKSLSGNKHK
jgi:septum formation protein